MKTQQFGTVTVELTAREFEVLALAANVWEERVVNAYTEREPYGYMGPKHYKETQELLNKFRHEYVKRPF